MSEAEGTGTVVEAPAAEGTPAAAAEEAAAALSTGQTTVVDEGAQEDGLSDAALEAQVMASLEPTTEAAAEGAAKDAAEPPPADAPKPVEPAPPAAPSAEETRIAELVVKQVENHRANEEARATASRLEARLAEYEAKLAAIDKALAENPMELLQARGHDLETLTRMEMGEKNPQNLVNRRILAELESLKRENATHREQAAAREAEARAAANVADYKAKNVEAPLAKQPGAFRFLAAEAKADGRTLTDVVYGEMNRLFQAQGGRGQVPAAEVVARELEQRAKQRYEAIGKEVTVPAPAKQLPSSKPKPKTITNSGTTTTTSPEDANDISDAALERRVRAQLAESA